MPYTRTGNRGILAGKCDLKNKLRSIRMGKLEDDGGSRGRTILKYGLIEREKMSR